MTSEPIIQQRQAKQYVAIEARVHMNDIPDMLPPLFPQVYDWLNNKNIPATGSPFFRYLAMNEKHELDVEVGVPVDVPTAPDKEIKSAFFPAGTYAVLTYTGDYMHLREAHMQLDAWLKQHRWKEDFQATPARGKSGVRTEFYINDPKLETDSSKWITEIAMLVTKDKEQQE